jgi:hypothetical protein
MKFPGKFSQRRASAAKSSFSLSERATRPEHYDRALHLLFMGCYSEAETDDQLHAESNIAL